MSSLELMLNLRLFADVSCSRSTFHLYVITDVNTEAKCREKEEEKEKENETEKEREREREKERERLAGRKRASSSSKAFHPRQEERVGVVRKQHSDEADDMKAFNMKQLELEKVRTYRQYVLCVLCVLCVRSCVLSDALRGDLGSKFHENLNISIAPTALCIYSHSLFMSTLPIL